MGGKSRKAENVIGKGKVTPVQVAFIVDRYLSDNNFVRTRSTFRTEASHLISKSPVNEAPKSLLSLGDMLDEYICLKEQKVLLNQEKNRLEQDRFRVQTLLRGMQDLMNAYTQGAGASSSTLPSSSSSSMLRPPLLLSPVNNTPVVMMSTSKPVSEAPTNFSTPTTTSQPVLKRRKNSRDVPSSTSKRTRTLKPSAAAASSLVKPPTNNNNNNNQQITPLPSNNQGGGSGVAKCLFNPGPQTPSPSPTVSPAAAAAAADNQTPPSTNTPQFNRTTVITSETIQVSPMKQVSVYSIERNHCITSPIKTGSKRLFSTSRDHVKGRLDFDGSETVTTSDENTESPSDAFDFDLPNLDCLGADFNLTDLLGDFDYFDNGSSPESLSGSPGTMVDDVTGDHELLSGMSSTVTEIRSEQDMNMPGGSNGNSVTSVKSITKCIKVFSPVKSRNP